MRVCNGYKYSIFKLHSVIRAFFLIASCRYNIDFGDFEVDALNTTKLWLHKIKKEKKRQTESQREHLGDKPAPSHSNGKTVLLLFLSFI